MGFTGELGGGGVHGVRRRPLWVQGVLGLGSVSVRVERRGWERLLEKQMERGRARQERGRSSGAARRVRRRGGVFAERQ